MSVWLAQSAGDALTLSPCSPDWLSATYGFSVYTTFRWPLPACWLSAHLNRLQHDAHALDLALPHAVADLPQALRALKPTADGAPQVVRLTVLADAPAYGDFYRSPAEPLPARLLVSTRPLPPRPAHRLALQSLRHEKNLPTLKLGAMGALIHARRQALRDGWDDCLLINTAHRLSEATTANVFALRGSTLYTPEPQRDGCLPGITRQQALAIAPTVGLAVSDAPLTLALLADMEAVFLTNAVQGVIPVARVDAAVFPWPAAAQERVEALRLGVEALNTP